MEKHDFSCCHMFNNEIHDAVIERHDGTLLDWLYVNRHVDSVGLFIGWKNTYFDD